jgi:lipopolysaccharide/colanic/teichoic acid biosynthesis glycosyltransferase
MTYDLHYVKHHSWRLDLTILGRTPLAVVKKEGAR